MKQLLKHLALLLLLLGVQQGAIVHELSHFSHVRTAAVGGAGLADTVCALCPAFAQVVTPPFSHAFHVPHLSRGSLEPAVELPYRAIDAAVPTPRSRGPPAKA